MNRQEYLQRLDARIEHVEGALKKCLELEYEKVGHPHVETLRSHSAKLAGAGEDWHAHRERVEKTWSQLHADVEAHGHTMEEVSESIRDGATELFRVEPSEIMKKAAELSRKAKETLRDLGADRR